MDEHTYKLIEIVGTSQTGIKAAIENGIQPDRGVRNHRSPLTGESAAVDAEEAL